MLPSCSWKLYKLGSINLLGTSLNTFTKRLSDFTLSVSSSPVPYSGQDVCANALAPSGADDGCRVGRAAG
jgi:hypothetical protein